MPRTASVAVLPFATLSGRKEDAYYGAVAAARGQLDSAIVRCETVIRQFGATPALSAALGMFYGMGGRRKEAREVLARLEEAGRRSYVSPMHRAWVYLGLGDRERALDWLAKAVEDRDPHVLHLAVKPVYDSLRQDPRFAALLRTMRLIED